MGPHELNILQLIFGRILKNRNGIEYEALQNEQVRKGKNVKKIIERILKEWFVKIINKDIPISFALPKS